jgi:hypothetical protein
MFPCRVRRGRWEKCISSMINFSSTFVYRHFHHGSCLSLRFFHRIIMTVKCSHVSLVMLSSCWMSHRWATCQYKSKLQLRYQRSQRSRFTKIAINDKQNLFQWIDFHDIQWNSRSSLDPLCNQFMVWYRFQMSIRFIVDWIENGFARWMSNENTHC